MGAYVSVDEVRAEGAPISYLDARIEARIAKWERIVERLTRNVFKVVDIGEITVDGNNYHVLHFNVPIVDVEYIKINNDTTELDADLYRVFNGKSSPADDRYNPRIELKRRNASIFSATRSMFAKGYDQVIKARWGYVDPDPLLPNTYITPPQIKDAIIQCVLLDLDNYWTKGMGGGSSSVTSPIKREKTDMHEIEYQQTQAALITWSNLPKNIYDELMLFRAPIAIGIPDTRHFVETEGGFYLLGY